MASGQIKFFTETELCNMKIVDLKQHLRELQLKSSGNKGQLIARILEHYKLNRINVNVETESVSGQNVKSEGSHQKEYSQHPPPVASKQKEDLEQVIGQLELQVTKLELELEVSRLRQELSRSQRKERTPVPFTKSSVKQTSTPVSNTVNKPIISSELNPGLSANNTDGFANITGNSVLENNKSVSVKQRTYSVSSTDYSTDQYSACSTCDCDENKSTVKSKVNPVLSQVDQPVCNVQNSDFVNKTDMFQMMQMLSDNLNLSRFPTPEPPTFDGDPMVYNEWNRAFKCLIQQARGLSDSDKLFYLKRYLRGTALQAVDGFVSSDTSNAYAEAKRLLDERYGNTFVISEAFRKKLDEWPKVQKLDSRALRSLSDFLVKCQAAMREVPEMKFLNYHRQNQQILRLLPDYIVAKWNQQVVTYDIEYGDFPPFNVFVKFLENESKLASHPTTSLEVIKKLGKSTPATASHTKNSVSHAVSSSDQCVICQGPHKVHECQDFNTLSSEEKERTARKHRLCFLCLNRGHSSKICSKRLKCKVCKRKHNTLLHRTAPTGQSGVVGEDQGNCGKVQRHQSNNERHLSSMIVPVWVSSCNNPEKKCLTFAMLDTQSDTTFISEEVAQLIEGESLEVNLKLSTMTCKDKVIKCRKYFNLTVCGYSKADTIRLPVTYTREFIPHNQEHLPDARLVEQWPHLRRISSQIYNPRGCKVGMLIGYNCPRALAPLEVVSGSGDEPYAVKTCLGWSVVGQLSSYAPEVIDEVGLSHRIICQEVPPDLLVTGYIPGYTFAKDVKFSHRMTTKELNVDAVEVMKLLEGDFCMPGDLTPISQEDQQFMKILTEHIRQDEHGYYEMPLPFKVDKPLLPNNRAQALGRFNNLKSKLAKDPSLNDLYEKFIDGLVMAGEAELIPAAELDSEEVWYLPHHGVFNINKPGKIRVVFDGSCKFKGHSLNQHLLPGPDLNNSLVGVLTRFRERPVALACDIAKMFHQFKVSKPCRDYLRFLWYHPTNKGLIADYRMTVHIFGAASSPGCAKFGLLKIASDHEQGNPQAANFIKRNFYVDDGLGSCHTVSEGIQLLKEARLICARGNLKLHKLLSNNLEVLKVFPKEDWATDLEQISQFAPNSFVERILGLKWQVTTDEFYFEPKIDKSVMTRRRMLSMLASIFDPLGFISPIILSGRQILQLTCTGIGWDDKLPQGIQEKWESWLSQLRSLSSIKITRLLQPNHFGQLFAAELHTFADASEDGYGACCYIRLVDVEGNTHCSLLFGKSRVPPRRKKITIPRLELQAALLAAKIGHQMTKELDLPCHMYYYSDSQIVLGYITNSSKRFHTFVANRVSQIRELTSPSQWSHVSSKDNPADHTSRGVNPDVLVTSNWFVGPLFLWERELRHSTTKYVIPDDDIEVRITHNIALTNESQECPILLTWLERYSKWSSALYFVAVIYNTVKLKWKGNLSAEVFLKAEWWLIAMLQQFAFPEEYVRLTSNNLVPKSSPLWQLNPYLDAEGIIRVGGRLQNSSVSYGEKHPVILPGRHHITTLIVRHHHQKVAHQGRGFTMSAIRCAGYWILNSSSIVTSVIYNCVHCRTMRRLPETQMMANLPEDRTQPTPPFTYVGCDCFGPFLVKEGRKTHKRYGLIFTCMASRAVHVELLDDMSSDSFLNSLRCLFALRGEVRQIRCDRGTNFIGAAREFELNFKVMPENVKMFLMEHKCDFVFNVPGASHMGGAWERQIRTFRNVLQGIMLQSHARLDISSTRTLFYEAMTIVNSRPITTVNDVEQEPLTPNRILHMKSGVVLPPPGIFEEVDLYSRKRWRRVQYLSDLFWKRWRTQYLALLQPRQKWQKTRRNMQVGDVVMLKEGTFRSDWRLGLVTETMASQDGLIRKVKLRMGYKEGNRYVSLERPVSKLVVLVES